jgi:hypothetical protein
MNSMLSISQWKAVDVSHVQGPAVLAQRLNTLAPIWVPELKRYGKTKYEMEGTICEISERVKTASFLA